MFVSFRNHIKDFLLKDLCCGRCIIVDRVNLVEICLELVRVKLIGLLQGFFRRLVKHDNLRQRRVCRLKIG